MFKFHIDLIINKILSDNYTCIEGWGFEKTEHNSTHIEVQDLYCILNLHGSTEHKMEKFFIILYFQLKYLYTRRISYNHEYKFELFPGISKEV